MISQACRARCSLATGTLEFESGVNTSAVFGGKGKTRAGDSPIVLTLQRNCCNSFELPMFNFLRKFSATGRCVSIISLFLFLTFLVSIQPHRVHHLFEDFAESGHSHCENHRGDSNHSQHQEGKDSCAIQSVAQNCHLNLSLLFQPVFAAAPASAVFLSFESGFRHFTPLASAVRAPPVA